MKIKSFGQFYESDGHKNLLPLDSVGTYIDSETGLTYAMMDNGEADLDNPVHVSDVDSEWIDSLSNQDMDTYEAVLKKFSSIGEEEMVTIEEEDEMRDEEEEEDDLDESKDKDEVTEKDVKRIRDIIRKAAGSHAKAIALARTMCKLITDPLKAVRRSKAAVEVGEDDLADIFNQRAVELGAFGG